MSASAYTSDSRATVERYRGDAKVPADVFGLADGDEVAFLPSRVCLVKTNADWSVTSTIAGLIDKDDKLAVKWVEDHDTIRTGRPPHAHYTCSELRSPTETIKLTPDERLTWINADGEEESICPSNEEGSLVIEPCCITRSYAGSTPGSLSVDHWSANPTDRLRLRGKPVAGQAPASIPLQLGTSCVYNGTKFGSRTLAFEAKLDSVVDKRVI